MEQVIGVFTGALVETQIDARIAQVLHTNKEWREEAWERAEEEKARQEERFETPEQRKYANSSPVPNQPFSRKLQVERPRRLAHRRLTWMGLHLSLKP